MTSHRPLLVLEKLIFVLICILLFVLARLSQGAVCSTPNRAPAVEINSITTWWV